MRIPDYNDLFGEYDRKQTARLSKRPFCVCCKDHIQEDTAYSINDELYCESCIKDARVYVEEDVI